MTGDLFSRALENADSITAEELKLTSLEKSEGETESRDIDKEGIEKIEASNVNETANGSDNDGQQNTGKVKDKSHEDDQVIERTIKKDAESVDNNVDNNSGVGRDDSNSSNSEYESHSNDSYDTDTSSSEEEEEMEEEVEEEEEDEGHNLNEPIRSKNEIVEEQIIAVPEDYKIDEKTKISEIGIIKSVFESNVIVQGTISGEKRVLKEGSIFCLENREVVGTLSEVFGQLQNPFYKVGISPVNETKNEIISKIKEMIGEKIFIVVPDAHWIDTFELKRVKGTDASNGYDEELPEEEQEFSDDEKEAQFKKMMKNKKKKKKTASDSNNNDNNNKVTKKKQHANYQEKSMYSKMKVPVGMIQQKYYTSRVNRNKDFNRDNNNLALDTNNINKSSTIVSENIINNNNSGIGYQNNPVFSNPSQGMYQSTATQYGHMAQQGQYNFNDFNENYQHSFMQNPKLYPQQQYPNSNFNIPYGGMHTQGYVNVNYPGQTYEYNPNYNMQYNYANHNPHFYSQQPNFQQQPPYRQNLNIHYQQNLQQAHVLQYQQQGLPPASNVTHTPNMERVRNFHEMLLQQNTNENGNGLSSQKTDKQTSQDNDIPY